MIAVLSKPRDEIDISDIENLIDSQVPEGEQIEFKGTLPAKGDDSPDPWMSEQKRIGDRAKNEILKEAVAFANAHGGTLLLGIGESKSKPPVAAEISPIPRCAELAERLKQVFRDCVEPQLPVLDVFAVPTKDESGVVVIRVGRSRLAPHRVMKTLVCPVRRADRCEEMTMREIQDMTLNLSRGLERLDKRLSDRSERFQEEFKRLETSENVFGIRVTAAPIGDEIWFERVFGQGTIINQLDTPWHAVVRQSGDRTLQVQSLTFLQSLLWTPILRGARGKGRFPSVSGWSSISGWAYRELHCDGMVETGILLFGSNFTLRFDWLIVIFANLVVWADHIRRSADAPMTEYALEVETCVKGSEIAVFLEDGGSNGLGNLQPGPGKPLRYPMGDSDDIPGLLALFERDFWNSLGEDIGPDENNLRIQGWPG